MPARVSPRSSAKAVRTSPATRFANAPESSIAALAAAGDDGAFAELVLRHEARVRALLRRMSGDAALADDLAQEAFVTAWRNLRSLTSPGAFGGWLRQIAVRTWLQHARRARLMTDDDFDEAVRTVADGAPAVSAERLDLERALARLGAMERLCVTLSYAEGLTHGEIADTTGLPLGTVKSHVLRGGSKLKTYLGMEAA